MASEATLGVLITGTDQASPTMKSFGNTIAENRMAVRELAAGVGFLGMSLASMGVMLKSTNTESGKSVGNMLLMAGAIMTAISSSVQLISAVAKMTDAFKKLAEAEIIAKAFSGPAGWATLAVGGAVAVGTVAAVNQMNRSEQKVQANIHTTVVLDGKQVGYSARKEIIKINQRTSGSGMMP